MKGSDKMDILVARSFRVLLAVTLAANCCLPCYTLAYADQPTYGGANYEQLRENQPERSGDGQADQGADFQGLLWREAAEKTSPGSEFLSLAGAGRVRPSADVLVEASYSLADSLIRLLSARAYADESQEVEDFPEEEQEEIAGDTGGLELSPGVVESDSYAADGESAAEGHGDDFGASEETGEDSPGLDAGLGDEGNFFERVLGSLDDITYILGEIADYYRQGQGGIQPLADDVYHQILGAIQTTNSKIDSLNAVALGSSAASNRFKWTVNGTVFNTSRGGLAWVAAYGVAILADIQSYTKSSSTSLSNLVSYATSAASDGNYYSFTKYLNMIYYQQQKQWGYGYGGTAVITNNSPASWLQALSSNSVSTASDGKSYSFAKYLNMINSHMGDLVTNVGWPYNGTSVTGFLNVINTEANNQTKTLEAMRKLLLSQNQNDEDWSVTKYANSINDKMGQLLENVGWPHNGTSVTGFLNVINTEANNQTKTLEAMRKLLLSQNQNDEDWSVTKYANSINDKMGQLLENVGWPHNGTSVTGFLNSILDVLRNDAENDLSETNKLLGRLTADVADIRDKLVLEDTLSDLLELLVGDLQVPQTQAAISRIQDVMATRFPFCIPSVVNVVLFGSLLAEPAPPVWTFDVGGSPLVVDFADYGAFAEVSSWTVRLLFTAALLLNTRRFVYGVGGGD